MFRKKMFRTTMSLTLTIMFLVSSISILAMVRGVQAAPPYTLKWSRNIGVATHIGALSAKLVPGGNEQDVVLTGVPQVDAGYTNGSVIALNGTNGFTLWTTNPGNILDHAPFEISDINNDGKQEVIVAEMTSTLALYGNGSVYWKNNAVPSYDVSPVTADVDGDGYKEVFVASGRGPYAGIDYISELNYKGQLIAQSNTSWHPCYGGLAIVDPKNDGHFILLMGDRSITYNPSDDAYKNGGWGVRALDARTLTPLWNDSSILSSSQIPMLADVDGDGVLDVVISAQSRGLAVYNITSGQVLDTGGIYRYSQNLGMSSHSQPTIYIDPNGIPQYITCQNSIATIWNLRNWTLTATLNWSVGEPPKMGRVTADGQMDMIVIEGSNVHIVNENFQEVGNITGMNQPNEMTLVSDVDGDGYNEIVFTTRSGWVYCYGTPAKATTPAPRTNVDYYSEYRNGVAEYVDPPGPAVPIITALTPINGATGVLTNISSLSFKLLDYWGYPMNYTVTTTPNIGTATGTNVYNGIYNVSVSGLQNLTAYSWTATATDGTHLNSTTFTFTTGGGFTNTAPIVSAPSPTNASTGVAITLSSLSFSLTDLQNDKMNYTVTISPNLVLGNSSGTNVTNRICNVSISGLQNSITYTWQVNATDGLLNTLANFTFTTNTPPQITAPNPSNGAKGVQVTLSTLIFNLGDADNDLMTYTVTTTPNIGIGNGTNVTNGTYNISIGGLQYSTVYSWQVTATDGKDTTLATFSFTTQNASVWSYRMNFTIDHTKVGGNLINFPVLVDITSTGLKTYAQTNGNDILFTDSSGNKLNHEIESYDSTSGHLVAWVLVPALSSTSDTTISLYYGNPSSPNQQNTTGVWDSNFRMVQHLDTTTSVQYDSTSNHNDGNAAGAVTLGSSGKIDGGINFAGGNITLPNMVSGQTRFTFSAWIYPQSGARYFISQWANNQGAFLQVAGNSVIQFYINGIMVQKNVDLNKWHYIVATFNGTTASLWVDGGSAASVSSSNPIWPSQAMYVGDRYDNTRQFIGLLDEVRVSNIDRSSIWINTEYLNQNSPSTFYTVGPQENLTP